jgi:RNA polymerase sigma factor (sigma-70 family)
MDVRSRGTRGKPPPGKPRRAHIALVHGPGGQRTLDSELIGQTLIGWQRRELRIARGFAECRGLSTEQLEDFYQDTAMVLIDGRYHDDEHLRAALRWGIKHRALQLHRDERRRGEILKRDRDELNADSQEIAADSTPELAALLTQDRLIVSEFLSELSPDEQRVFWLMAEGMRYRAIATAVGITVNEARNTTRACERKRERFQLLYDTGRLCGFRAATIQALQAGQATSEQLAAQVFVHLESCAHCRAEHKTNARRLRRSFQGQAAALLPIPALAAPLGWLARIDMRARALQQRLLPGGTPPGGGGVRERAVALLASSGAAAKVAVGVATVAVIAGGTIATHALQHPTPHAHASRHGASRATRPETVRPAAPPTLAAPVPTPPPRTTERLRSSTRRALATTRPRAVHDPAGQYGPGGFSYLGVPTSRPAAPEKAEAHVSTSGQGGPFSP